MTSHQPKKRLYLFLLPLVIILGILAYYQFLYKSEVVNKGYVRPVLTYKGHRNIVTAIRFSKNDSILVTSSVDSTIQLWNSFTGVLTKQIKHSCAISYMDASKDGRLILTGGYDSIVRVWDAATGNLVREFPGHQGTVWTVAFSDDAKMIAGSGDDAIIYVWDVPTGRLIQKLKEHKRIVWSVKFSPDIKDSVRKFTFPLFFGELAIILWLLIMGVKAPVLRPKME